VAVFHGPYMLYSSGVGLLERDHFFAGIVMAVSQKRPLEDIKNLYATKNVYSFVTWKELVRKKK